MTEIVDELAELIWQTNLPGATPLLDTEGTHPDRLRVYRQAAIVALRFVAERDDHPALELAKDLAYQLAFKLNNPWWFADSVRESFDRFADLIGEENLNSEIRIAREI